MNAPAAGDPLRIAQDLVRAGRPAQALAALEAVAGPRSGTPEHHFTRGLCLAGVGRAAEAIESYRQALASRPGYFEAAANLGNLLQVGGRHAEAAECYRQALALRPGTALVLNGLGLCELALGRTEAAERCFREAVDREPGLATAHNNLGIAAARLGRIAQACGHSRRAVELRPDFTEAWINLGEQLYQLRRDDEALASLERALVLDPSREAVRYLRDAIAGVQVDRAPDAFVSQFFDRFAADFDERLTGELEYRAPGELRAFIDPWLGGRTGLRIADLGCGTGLAAAALRPIASRLVGVDLSAAMLERARSRGTYDELEHSEVGGYLGRQPPGSFDLVTALDVFVYLGDLAPLFAAVARALAPEGLFAFTIESGVEGGVDFRLARTGRYAHSPDYVDRLGRACGLRALASRPIVVRRESGRPVAGRYCAFVRER